MVIEIESVAVNERLKKIAEEIADTVCPDEEFDALRVRELLLAFAGEIKGASIEP